MDVLHIMEGKMLPTQIVARFNDLGLLCGLGTSRLSALRLFENELAVLKRRKQFAFYNSEGVLY